MPIALADIVNWSASISMFGGYRGSIRLTNQNVQYTENTLLWSPVSLGIESTGGTIDITLPECFFGTTLWLNGIIHSAKDDIKLSDRHIVAEVRSYFAQMSRKPVTTEYFSATNTNTPLDSVATTYGAIPSGLLNLLLSDPNRFFGVVHGNSILDELAKLAQSAEADLFTQIDGKLTAEHWKNINSPIDVIIPNEAVISATKNLSTAIGPSRVVVRGRFISEHVCGEQTLSNENTEDPCEDQDHRSAEDQGKIFRNSCFGLTRPHVSMNVKNIKGRKEDLRSAAVIVDGTCSAGSEYANPRQPLGDKYENMISVDEGEIDVLLTDNCEGILEAGDHLFKMRVVGRNRHTREHGDPNTRRRPLRANQTKNTRFVQNMLSMSTGVQVARLNDVIGGVVDTDKSGDSKDTNRIEMEVTDPDLAAEFGIITEQIDNDYICDYETLFDVAVRRFNQFKMGRKTWTVQTVYLPCLKLNQKVQFVSPDNNEIVNGLLTDISIKYDTQKPKSTMMLTIQSFEQTGSTSYTSSNLLTYPELCGSNGTDWILAAGDVHFFDCFAVLFDGSILRQVVWLEVGEQYTLTAELKKKAGTDVTTSIDGNSQVCSATCSVSITFTASTVVSTLEFNSNGEWILKEPKLVKTVTR